MKIAILTSGILPVPSVQGGAVENLIDFYLDYNRRNRLHDITIYSVYHPQAKQHPALQSDVNHYYFIDTSSIRSKIKRELYKIFHKHEYYNYFIEFYFEEAFKDIREKRYDCIILENRPGYAYKLSRYGNYKIILHLHNDLLNQETKNNLIIYNNLRKILTVSNYIKKQVSSISLSDKTQVVHNGIDLQRFSTKQTSSLKRNDLGFEIEDFILVFSGRINKDKGISELIDAMLLLKDRPKIKLMIIGSSFFGNAINENGFIHSLKEKAKQIEGRMVFTGFIPYEEMPEYLQLADIAVIPSIWNDPFPTTELEAQAMGLPIITTRRGGIPEEVTVENAILLDTDENFVNNLASSILELYEHPEKRKLMAAASLERSKIFEKDSFAKNFFKALQDV